jgi:elongation factor 1 alpha-like protein
MAVAVAHFETPKFRVVVLDLPGHRDFVPSMISGASQADAAILVVDASMGAFEAGMECEGGQTREHTLLLRSLGIEQIIVAVNKMDSVDYLQGRFDAIKAALRTFLRQCGFKDSGIKWIPVSALENQNLVTPPTQEKLKTWWAVSNCRF